MKLNRNDYTVEAAAGGGFYAYFMNNVLCSAYGETPDEACENLEQIVDDFVSDMYDIPSSYADRIILFTYLFHKFS